MAQKLNAARPEHLSPLNICLQLHLDEHKKTGIPADELLEVAQQVQRLSRLHLRGLMAIPSYTTNTQQQYSSFVTVYERFQQLNTLLNKPMDTLSMGMSDDLEAAVHAGSTMIRIGRDLFGTR
jgi:pyridoxal phosphate enzyme (YggS family)